MSAMIQTVLGSISPESLGITLAHEHLIHDSSAHRVDPTVVFDDPVMMVDELTEFRDLGGRAVVELTPIEIGRDVSLLWDISRDSGLHVVAATGFYTEISYPPFVRQGSIEQIANHFVKELTQGIDDTGIRAGVIGEIGTSEGAITDNEKKVFQASAMAQERCGAPIFTHTYWGTLGLEQIALLGELGADLSRVAIGHIDSQLDFDYHQAIADSGAYLAYDCVGKTHHDPEFGHGFPTDVERADMLIRLIEAGYVEQLLLS